jgi:hypothetical protein
VNLVEATARNSDPGRKDDYAVYFYRFLGASCAGPMFMPDRCKNPFGLRYYRIYLGDYYFDIKADKKPTPKKILPRVISDKEPLYIHCVNLKGSPELEILRKMVDSPNNKNI